MLKIGRKLYFNKQGDLILDTGERMGAVRETSIQEDFYVFPQLREFTPGDVVVKQMYYGERGPEFELAGSVKLVNDEVVIYPPLVMATDKLEIVADGVDTAAITATLPPTYTDVYTVNFVVAVDGVAGDPIPMVTQDIATLPITTTVPGEIIVTATSDLFGTASITVKGV